MRRLLVVAATALLVGCASSQPAAEPEELTVRVIAEHPWDSGWFIQGLEFDGDDLLVGTGIAGESQILRLAQPLEDQQVVESAEVPDNFFGEGITRIGADVWQLTWKDQVALRRDAQTFDIREEIPYARQGWGICARADGSVVTSDGSDELVVRNANSLAEQAVIEVTYRGEPVTELNELECTGTAEQPVVWANEWQTDNIYRIDGRTDVVTARVDASALREMLPPERTPMNVDVLNGIAAIAGTNRFVVTGKYWPVLFEVEFVPAR
ncbi:glutaminyl-peptide cyclotransferase [Corynebacterium sp. TAE3-ERU12]|uniref:glutaminyl-peptide cyclotransferase n=1 Tax=Corynebacterium sp. TAE3-ERU12 TaxID=2849491 RepID=UPI001C47D60C|nr:glutaminyl-peptide cyclotransferase [Corynebacterium sp. TAE3-ERU12]MBV7295543.1 glutaminyl-peptide cyclotransferase [Corynebacterium sp. TAE3-ERU12]